MRVFCVKIAGISFLRVTSTPAEFHHAERAGKEILYLIHNSAFGKYKEAINVRRCGPNRVTLKLSRTYVALRSASSV